MTVVFWVAGAMLAVAAVLSLVRVAIGPRMLNRALAAEVIVAVVIAAIALQVAYIRDGSTLPVMLALAMVGFVGSIAVARYAGSRDSYPDRRSTDGQDAS